MSSDFRRRFAGPALLDNVVERAMPVVERTRAGNRETFDAAAKALGVAEAATADLGEVTGKPYRRYDALRRADHISRPGLRHTELEPSRCTCRRMRAGGCPDWHPPWLAFRYMSDDLAERFRRIAQGENIYVGGKLCNAQTILSGLFFARSVALI